MERNRQQVRNAKCIENRSGSGTDHCPEHPIKHYIHQHFLRLCYRYGPTNDDLISGTITYHGVSMCCCFLLFLLQIHEARLAHSFAQAI